MIGIYKITSPSGRIYIGQSVDIDTRWIYYRNLTCKSQPKIYNSLKKYGAENHIFEIIEECGLEELNNKEGYWQDFYNSIHEGLNCRRQSIDGDTGYDCQETKDKRRDALLGRKRPPEAIANMRKPRPHTRGKNNIRSEKVENYITGEVYDSLTIAADLYGYGIGTLGDYLRGKAQNPTNLRYVNPEKRPNNYMLFLPRRSQIILDTSNGVYYYGVSDAAIYTGYTKHVIISMLNGRYRNRSTLIYA